MMANSPQPAFALAQLASSATVVRRWRRPRPHVALERRTALICGGALVALLAWSAASTSYILFRDRILHDIRVHHAIAERMAAARNAELRAEVDHLKSARMTDRAVFGDDIDRLTRRQALLEHRQSALREVAGGDGRQLAMAAPPAPAAVPTPVPAPSDTLRLASPQQPPQVSRAVPLGLPPVKVSAAVPHGKRLAMLARGYEAVEASQAAALVQFEHKLDRQRDKLRAIYRHVGVKVPAAGHGEGETDTGGPYIPIAKSPLGGDTAFDHALQRILTARLDVQRLRGGLEHVPVGAPLPQLIETSEFGAREDPFYGSLAFHPGIDLRAGVGTPVHATAAGKVTAAGWAGGYGNMVEIDHGDGLRTRYGHLSKIEVKVGDSVVTGQEIGHTGSTGRSTGPHLHYEVRVDGQPVDPTRFVTAEHELVSAYGQAQD